MLKSKSTYTLFSLLFACILIWSCKNETASNESLAATTPEVLATSVGEGIELMHTFVEVYDTTNNPRVEFVVDTIMYAMHNKYLYVDKLYEVRPTTQPDTIKRQNMSDYHPFVMQVHFAQAPVDDRIQLIKIAIDDNVVPYSHLTQRASGSNFGFDGTVSTSFFADCYEASLGCKAKFLIKNIAQMSFM